MKKKSTIFDENNDPDRKRFLYVRVLFRLLISYIITPSNNQACYSLFSILPINVYQLLDDQHLRFVLYCILKIILTTKIIYIIITLKDREKIDIKFRFLFSYFSK